VTIVYVRRSVCLIKKFGIEVKDGKIPFKSSNVMKKKPLATESTKTSSYNNLNKIQSESCYN
jgi:hypothetical protein